MKISIFKIDHHVVSYDRPADAMPRKPFPLDAKNIPPHDRRNVEDPRNRTEFRPGFPDRSVTGHSDSSTTVLAAENQASAIAGLPKSTSKTEEVEVLSIQVLM